MKVLVLVFLVSSISIISLISGTPLQYDEKYSFELISIDINLLTKHDPTLTRPRHQQQRSLLSSAPPVTTNQLEVLFGSGMTYLMSVGVGTPPQNVYLSLDTGSDITWLQCLPCSSKKYSCYNQSDPIFDPSHSSTFSQIGCGDPRCKQLQGHFVGCGGKHKKICLYNATYGSGSFSQGAFSTETLTLGNTKELLNISFGCGHDNQGDDWTADSDGLLGLGRGNLSFITQTKHRFKRQFSYCFASPFSITSNSSIVFGPYTVPHRKHVYYTPLIYTNKDTYYYVNLTAILVNGTRVPGINSSISDVKLNGSVIVDSGTRYTRLVNKYYVALRDAFREAIQKQTNPTVSVGSPLNYLWFDTCYNISPPEKLYDVEVPMVELHFDQGANMTLPPDNTVTVMDNNGTVATLCFAFESDDWYTTIGNFQQQTFQIVYDVPGGRVGFVPDSC